MNVSTAKNIWKLLNKEARQGNDTFDLTIINDGTKKEKDFHEWVDMKKVIGIIKLVRRIDKFNLYFILIDWYEKGKWYLIVFKDNRAGPIINFWKTDTIDRTTVMHWNYSPRKKDGENEKRKKLFKKCYGDLNVTINLPASQDETSSFITELFQLADIRTKADNLDKSIVDTEKYSSKTVLSDKLIHGDSYLPTKSDCERAIQQLGHETSRQEFDVRYILKRLKTDLKEAGRNLKGGWAKITKENLKKWFS